MFDDACSGANSHGQSSRIGYRSERAIQDQVALIGDKRRLVNSQSHRDLGAQTPQVVGLLTPAEPHHFNGYHPACTEYRAQLGAIDNSDTAMASLSHDLLAEHRPTSTFDEVQLGANLVGAIDRDVNLSGKIVSQQRNAHSLRRDGGSFRCWHRNNIV